MKRDTKNVILIVLALVVSVVALYGIVSVTNNFVTSTPEVEEGDQLANTPVNTAEALGVVHRITEPSTGAITGYDVRGMVMDTDSDENVITLNVSEDSDEVLLVSLGSDVDIVGFLDKRTEASQREGLLEKNTYTSNTAEVIFERIAVGQTILVHVPVWVETPDASRCDVECMERIQTLRTRGEVYTPLLEAIIQTSVVETDAVFFVSMVEIEQ